jgi:nucleoside-diphosphate-sugar epimerase
MTINPVKRPVDPAPCGGPARDPGAAAVARALQAPPARPGRVLVLGGGFTGQRFARALARLGVPVGLTSREPTPPEGPSLQAHPDATDPGLRWLGFDPERGLLPDPADLEGTTHVLVTIPPDAAGRDPVLTHLGEHLAGLPLAWVGYLSTTGVYGDRAGGWVDEASPVAPGLERSRARLACERAWERLDLPLQVFRLPAIYGPGRTPFADLRQGRARLIHKPGQVFCRIHVDDIVGGLLHCLALPAQERPPTLILADQAPCPSSETLGYAAHLLGCRLPEVQPWSRMEAKLSPMARSFWSENRRVSSRLLREGLGYRLLHPTYREGYRACFGLEEERKGSGPSAGPGPE